MPAFITQPLVFPNSGHAPLGNPMAFNPGYIAASLQHRPVAAMVTPTPWIAAHVNSPFVPTVRPLDTFLKATWCITCGHRKKDHHITAERFGTKCIKGYCARCGQLQVHHVGGMMGPHCTHPAVPNSPHLNWKYK